MENVNKPWWDGHPQLEAARDEALAWLRSAEDRPPLSEEPDPVVMDIYSGACRRELPRRSTTLTAPALGTPRPYEQHARRGGRGARSAACSA